MNIQIPGTVNLAVGVPLQLLFLAALGSAFHMDLRQDCRKRPAATALLIGLIAGLSLSLIARLVLDDGALGALCRGYYKTGLPDAFWVVADFAARLLFVSGVSGLIVVWLAVRFWVRGIRADKTTMLLAGALIGLAVGAGAEVARVRWGSAAAMCPPRLVFCSLMGGLLGLVCRWFLFRKGRFQFGIKDLLALTLVWAIFLSWLGPQWRRYDDEDQAVREIEAILGKPVQCQRSEGWTGLEYVSHLQFPQCRIADEQVGPLIVQLRRLPRLSFVHGGPIAFSRAAESRLQEALPRLTLGLRQLTVE